MSGTDVVARLAAHQQNLEPQPPAGEFCLVALPAPRLCRALAPEVFSALRRRDLQQLAEELGGGDGPLPVLDLDLDPRSLPRLLDDLQRQGVRTLFLRGAADQPGFARAIGFRWDRGLHVLGGDAQGRHGDLARLMEDRSPVLLLAPGIARTLEGAAPPADAARVLAGTHAAPAGVLEELPRTLAYAFDPDLRLGPWSGFLPPRACLGTEEGGELRRRWHEVWSRLGWPHAVRQATLGLDPELEARLAGSDEAPAAVSSRARVFVVTGLDGSGKTAHARRLCHALRQRGGSCETFKIYRSGAFLDVADELGARTRRGAPLGAFRVSRIVKLVDSLRACRDHLEAALAACDAVVMDRYVETHVAAARAQLGWELGANPALAVFPRPDLTVWLRLDPGIALERLRRRQEKLTADEHEVGLGGYAASFDELAEGGDLVLDATADEEENAARVLSRALATKPTFRGGSSPGEPPAAAVRREIRPRERVLLGGGEPEAELGGDIAALRSFLAQRLGDAAAGSLPESFWIEAYAAQLVIDLWSSPAAGAATGQRWIALWPAALDRMSSIPDLAMLAELGRMLRPLLEVAGWTADPLAAQAAFQGLGACPPAARRLAQEYLACLQAEALEEGWPEGPMEGPA